MGARGSKHPPAVRPCGRHQAGGIGCLGRGVSGALLRCPWTTAPHGHREGDTPQEEPWIPEERVPGDRMLVGIVRSINHTSLDQQPGDSEHTPVDDKPDRHDPSERSHRPGSRPGREPARAHSHEHERRDSSYEFREGDHPQRGDDTGRPLPTQRSISPPTVSINAEPPSAQYTLTAALAAPRLAAITAATTAPRSSRVIPQACTRSECQPIQNVPSTVPYPNVLVQGAPICRSAQGRRLRVADRTALTHSVARDSGGSGYRS